ncbi:polyhydroxyalkanoate synthase [Evansella vedderi]|uniref:Polyhydroxyalkanoate synthase n=1 Tax=Evansella vedderi TaxID=38282 RepID=A0ABT9ZWP8_9BACI|nr:alpha/beta fold hydrolase [Evansella vedderi]MDQ0255294.1 polyhydroxyalkanoate synthase [Evansella vedderi]
MRKRKAGKLDKLFPQKKVGLTPKTAIWKKNKATLWYYPAKKKKYKTPLFLIYSLINQSYILDLSPGMSMIEAFVKEGYDVYLLDFGVPGYEDKDLTLDDYIIKYIQKGVRRSLYHSEAGEITIIGYCLGGTLATIYGALAKEPIRNIILFAPPLDFGQSPIPEEWEVALRGGELALEQVIEEYGIVPAEYIEFILRMSVSPVNYSKYLTLLQRADDKEFVRKWELVNDWLKDHIPFAGATLKQLINELAIKNKLIKNKLQIQGNRINLRNIKANLLVISTSEDEIVPEQQIKAIMSLVSSKDKTYKRVKGGHVSLALKGDLPEFLQSWLRDRSNPIN